MKAEIIAIGTELLLGEVVNTNAAWLSRELAALGVDVYHHHTVGDNPVRISAVLKQAASRADWLIITGGLGPTDDDLTLSTLADCFHAPLIPDPESEAAIRRIFQHRGLEMPPSNLKQALKPEGAVILRNSIGTAPGIAWKIPPNETENPAPVHVLAFPGVPRELYAMWPQARDFIRQRQAEGGQAQPVLLTRFLHFFGLSESALAEHLSDLMQGTRPSVAPYVGKNDIRLRLGAKATTKDEASALIERVQTEILRRVGRHFIGESDDADMEAGQGLEKQIADLLIQYQWRLGTAESCTGGLISSRLTDVAGSGSFLCANVVTYNNSEKRRRLGVQAETLERHGAVSPEVAAEMAFGIRQDGDYEIGLSITGQAGPVPDNQEDEPPPGLAYVGISLGRTLTGETPSPETALTYAIRLNPSHSRCDLKAQFAQYALYHLYQALQAALKDRSTAYDKII